VTNLSQLLGFRPRIFRPLRVVEAAQAFIRIEASSGIVLVAAALAAMVWVNSPWGDSYADFWHSEISLHTPVFSIDEDLVHLVNDGLMTLFFFLVGLEIKRELVHGELSSPRRALLPAAAALGGMVAPALIYLAFNAGGAGADGWGIPMATDIAFALGVLSLLGRRVPFTVKVFLLALAIADDIGAILVIAIFYTQSLNLTAMALAGLVLLTILLMNRAGVRTIDTYVLFGALLWLCVFESGVHATLAGVVLGLLCPATHYYDPRGFPAAAENLLNTYRSALQENDVDEQSGILGQMEDLSQGTEAPLDRLERELHPWVSYLIVPVFALANAGVAVSLDIAEEAVASPVAQGVALGLVVGKPLGILAFTWLAVRLGLCELPRGASWGHVVGIGMLGGIGFTVSLLITDLAFSDLAMIDEAKLGILAASVLAGVGGFVFLRLRDSPASAPVSTREA
jgi:NhaA family Na+:H+ antiporter